MMSSGKVQAAGRLGGGGHKQHNRVTVWALSRRREMQEDREKCWGKGKCKCDGDVYALGRKGGRGGAEVSQANV